MIRLQRLLGCRPQDVCGLRPSDLERQGDIWWYVPQRHKTAYLDQERRIAVGPRAQALLEPYLRRSADAYCFSPQESEAGRHLRQRLLRRSPVPPSQQGRASLQPTRPVGDRYDTRAYNRVIARACRRAGIAKWSPNQLRHAAGTETRRQYGLEAAQAVLGQKRLETTQIYAERRQDLAAEIMREIG